MPDGLNYPSANQGLPLMRVMVIVVHVPDECYQSGDARPKTK